MSPLFAPLLFDHECIEWCLQNSDGLIGVQVLRDAQSDGRCYCLYDAPNGLPSYSGPAHEGTWTVAGTGAVTQISEADDWVCYAAVST